MTYGFRVGAATDTGVARDANQDSYATAPGLAVVADGMGGHLGGEVASSLAVQEFVAYFSQFDGPDLRVLVEAVEQANRRILDAAAADPMLHHMGTTEVALALIDVPEDDDAGQILGAINVGDSRMYRLTGESPRVLEQLTEDHSLVEALVREGRLTPEQAEVHPQRNIVTRALGVVEHVEVDSFHFIPKLGDRYLLCSDGLFNEVSAQDIAELLAHTPDPQTAAEALIAAANAGGGRDNITTVIVDIVEADQAELPAAGAALASDAIIDGELTPADPNDDAVALDVPENVADSADAGDNKNQRWSWRR